MPRVRSSEPQHSRLAKKLAAWKWNEASIEQLKSVHAILLGLHVPVQRISPDGTPAEVCVVCGDLLFPRESPRCEGCPDPDSLCEGDEIHIDFRPAKSTNSVDDR